MRLASFQTADGRRSFGSVNPDGSIVDLASGEVTGLRQALAEWGVAGLRQRAAEATRIVPAGTFAWLPPVTDPDKIITMRVQADPK